MPDDEQLWDAEPARLDIPVCRSLGAHVETRADGDGGMPTMTGHFSVFDEWYEIDSLFEGRFLERTAPGAFKKTMRESARSIRVLLEHGFDPTVGDKPLGVPRALREDERGASYEVDLFDTSYNRDLVPALEAGAYGSSFRFRVMKDEWVKEPGKSDHNPNGIPERTIKEVRVMEFGPTVFPANPAATAGLRSTTDRYYDQLRKRSPEQYDEALRRVHAIRNIRTSVPPTPAAKDTPAAPRSTGAADRTGDAKPAAASAPRQEPRKHSVVNQSTEKRRSTVDVTTMTIEERAARQDEIRSRLAEIDTEFNGAQLPDETQQEWDSLTVEFDEHDAAIQAAEKRRRDLEARARRENATERVDAHRTGYGAPEVMRSRPENIFDLTELRRNARSLDELPKLYRDNAMRAVEQARFPGVKRREDAQAQVEHLLHTVDDDQGTLARRILITGSPLYDRAFGKAVLARSTNGLTADEMRAMSLGTDTAGGFAVPYQLDPTVILTSDGSINPLRQVSRVEQIVGKEWQGITSAGVTVTRSPEAQEATDNSPTIAQPAVRPTRVLGFVPFSMEIDQDWGRLRAELTRLLADAKDQEEAQSFVTGNGTGENPSGIVATLPTNRRVAQTGAAGAFSIPDDLFAVEEALPPRFRARASWLANKSIYNQIRGASTGSDGGELWVRLGAGMPSELLGYQARELSTMDGVIQPTGAGANLILLFGDYATGFLIVDRIGMSIELVPHLFGATNRFPTGQRGIVAVWRNSSKILVDNAIRVLNVVSPT